MLIAQGNVADRPFARTIFSLAAKRFTGDLVLTKSRLEYRSSWENGQIVARPMNYLALSYDHRIVDGREAVLSLVAIKDALEDPARMLLEV